MLEKFSVTIDVTQEETILHGLPRGPVVSSAAKGWQGIYVANHCQPAWQTPELSFLQHSIMIYTGQPIQGERYIEGCWLQGIYTYGKIGIHPASVGQKISWNGQADFIQICLSQNQLITLVDSSIDSRNYELLPQFAVDDALIYGIGLALQAQMESNCKGNHLYVESATTLLAVHLLQHYGVKKTTIQKYTGGLSRSHLQSVIDYINTHLDQDISLVQLASLVRLSPNYFLQLFKQSTGVTPYQYVLNCRINTAKRLLAQQDLSIAQIAQQVGFYDQSRFTKLFRKRIKMTPKQYRNQL
jgi:AraC family transcriptional regulator